MSLLVVMVQCVEAMYRNWRNIFVVLSSELVMIICYCITASVADTSTNTH